MHMEKFDYRATDFPSSLHLGLLKHGKENSSLGKIGLDIGHFSRRTMATFATTVAGNSTVVSVDNNLLYFFM